MLLVADVGNTNTKIGVFDGERLLVSWRLTSRREQTADEWPERTLRQRCWLSPTQALVRVEDRGLRELLRRVVTDRQELPAFSAHQRPLGSKARS